MKICLFTSSFLPVIGGVEFAIHNLAENYVKMGHDVTVLAGRETKISNKINIPYSYKVKRYRYPPKGLFVNQLLLRLLYEKYINKFDVLHANFLYFPGYVGVCFKKICKIPVVVTAHGEDIQVQSEINYGMMLDPKKRKRIKHVIEKSDAVTAICDSIKEDFLSAGTDPEKLFSIPHGTNVESFETVKINMRQKFNIPDDHKVVIGIGRNHPKKRFEDLVESASLVLKKYTKVTFVIVGKATEILQPLVDKKGIQKNVILSSPILGDEYTSLYSIADIYVTPSLIEGASLSNLDALGAGLPIVASNVMGTRDFVKQGENGILVEPRNNIEFSNAILKLLNDEVLYNQLSEGAKEMGHLHDWKNLAKQYESLYLDLVKKYKK